MSSSKADERVTYIYGLADPDTGEVLYIGKADDPQRRFVEHLADRSDTRKARWIADLRDHGREPTLVVFQGVPFASWRDVEAHWIRAYVALDDDPLMNDRLAQRVFERDVVPTTGLRAGAMLMKPPEQIHFTILGSPQSKANSRQLVFHERGGVKFPAVIKSKKALQYVRDFKLQCPKLQVMLTGDLHADIDIYYQSARSDLDESLILDCMQGCIYENDRQIRSRRVRWGVAPSNPRTVITLRPMEPSDYAP